MRNKSSSSTTGSFCSLQWHQEVFQCSCNSGSTGSFGGLLLLLLLIWIFLEVTLSRPILQDPSRPPPPPLQLVLMTSTVESYQVKTLTKEFSKGRNLMKSSSVISLASLISNCHLIFLSTFFPRRLSLSLRSTSPAEQLLSWPTRR